MSRARTRRGSKCESEGEAKGREREQGEGRGDYPTRQETGHWQKRARGAYLGKGVSWRPRADKGPDGHVVNGKGLVVGDYRRGKRVL